MSKNQKKDLTERNRSSKASSDKYNVKALTMNLSKFSQTIWGILIFLITAVLLIVVPWGLCKYCPSFSLEGYLTYIFSDMIVICLVIVGDKLFLPVPARPAFVHGIAWMVALAVVVQIAWVYNARQENKKLRHEEAMSLAFDYYSQAQAVQLPNSPATTPKEKEELVETLKKKIPLLRKAVVYDPGKLEYRAELEKALGLIPWQEVPGSRFEVVGKGFGSGDKGKLLIDIKKLKKGDKYVIISRHFQMKKEVNGHIRWVSHYKKIEVPCTRVPNGYPYAFRAEKGEKAVVFVMREM